MKNLSIKIKLIIIFILIKIIPLLVISYIAYEGVLRLDNYLKNNTSFLFTQSRDIIVDTANKSINDSIKNLDKKSQLSLERVSYEIASNIAQFLYQRDEDILFLSKLDINNKILKDFYDSKMREIFVHDKYIYNEQKSKWELKDNKVNTLEKDEIVLLKDNEKEFNYTNPLSLKRKRIPIYKELVLFDLLGKEKFKVSAINSKLLDISKKENTYINSETYFDKIDKLKEGELYVSNVIGEYIGSKIIGTFTKEKAAKANIKFEPQNHAYAGIENPLGKKFEGIIRFITPVFKDGEKIAYISLALDHEHIMQFTDTSNPTSANVKQNIANASDGNYAFMWDNKGRNISHPRDYFITGYDKKTGLAAKPWLSADVANKYEQSNKKINHFLKEYPTFENQTLSKKPNIKQLKEEGNIGLDCRYLNFAPQCQGWMQITKNGGYGSFLIYWSKVWKLTTAAVIPYYTGEYVNSKRGFGFVSIGANVDEFHSAANKTKENIDKILENQTENIKKVVDENSFEIDIFIKKLVNELTIVTFIMLIIVVLIALLLSSYISKKIEKLLTGTTKFSNNELDYRIKVSSKDEIGKLEESFNVMASKISKHIRIEKEINETLEKRIQEGIEKQRKQEQLLIHQSKLASMGEMIGNIAHQWRQPLNALGLVLQNIQFTYEVDELNDKFMSDSVDKSQILINNMSKTIDDFRNFFKPNKSKEDFNLNNSINEAKSLLSSAFKHQQIKLIIKSEEEKIIINGYSNEFLHALINILNNAKDAFSESNIENAKVTINCYSKNSFVIVEIQDNATGIDENIIDKIFDPYFSTKEEGKGVGIGLYMTKTIIESHMKGELKVKNKDDGVEFIIKIPL